jgi:hypothetical protein
VTVGAGFRENDGVEIDEVQRVEGAGASLVDRLASMPRTLASVISLVHDS